MLIFTEIYLPILNLTRRLVLANRIWIDVEDLFIYWSSRVRPSGIQRLEFELCRALVTLPQSRDRICFLRHDVKRHRLISVPWEDVEAIFDLISGDSHESEARRSSKRTGVEGRTVVTTMVRSLLRKAIYTLSPGLRKIVVLQVQVFIGLAELVHAHAGRVAGTLQRRQRPQTGAASIPLAAVLGETTDYFAATARPGDILATFGSPWITPSYNSYAERAVRETGLRLALLIYDIIPLRRPEWCDEALSEHFRAWLDAALPMANTVLTISASTAKEVMEYARKAGVALQAIPSAIPIGTGFKKSDAARQRSNIVSNRLPAPNSYALVVSTIEPRKNHALLFRVWRRLLDDMPAASVPTLVFAGRIGWLVSDLMQQLHNSRFLDGKIIHISPTDEELEALYKGCLFTLYPSFYEGWGLPVTESHAFGRPCIISNTTSLTEAGGSLARYIDPDNTTDACRVIRETIEDQASLREWRDRVQRDFRPVEWSESADAVLGALNVIEDVSRTMETERHRA
jgi:glycosyltransferase involved in cell wall biosynthesis